MIICDICPPSTSVWSGSGLPSERWWWYEIIFYCGFTSDSVPFTHQPVGYHSFTVIIKQTNGINSSQSKKILLLFENYCEGERRDKCGEENKTWRCYLICINVTVTNLSCYTSQLQLINGKLCRSRRCSIIIFIFVDVCNGWCWMAPECWMIVVVYRCLQTVCVAKSDWYVWKIQFIIWWMNSIVKLWWFILRWLTNETWDVTVNSFANFSWHRVFGCYKSLSELIGGCYGNIFLSIPFLSGKLFC